MTKHKPLSIAIVGGGISGLCLAIGLLRHPQFELSIFESSPAFIEIGAGLALGPNAQRALGLLSPAVEQAFWNLATGNTSPEFSKRWFNFRYSSRGGQEDSDLGSIENQSGQQTVHRAKFLHALASIVPDGIVQFGKRLVRVSERGESTLLHFADGTTANADCVIGADGVHSNMRKHLLGAATPEAAPVFSGIVAYRGLIPMEHANEALDKYAHDAYLWCGDEGMVMSYPIDSGQVLNVVAAHYRSSWDEGAYVVDSKPEKLRKDFESFGEIPREIIKLLGIPKAWALLDHLPAPRLYSKNIAIVGDAAHATTPFQGAGAGQAIEDVLVLSQLLARVHCIHEIEPAFAAYDILRRPRTERIVQTSREAMELYTVTNTTEKWKQAWHGRMNWIWDIDLEAHVADALTMFEQRELGGCSCRMMDGSVQPDI
ncbi:related to salicylate 1-monooxygenase [Fusarium torulosum]|uniref:Related to salicylate 1-monooxygenase n=1 Tax=Fusarium torulosum TaxID=33205 RepID=A0AAE8SDT8_9HYPO|nr:related to salicylate 1-monooxygenase [Fusarium torulosum]